MTDSQKKVIGHIASATTYTIFGLNIVMCKDIANSETVSPYALYLFRAIGATALFWLCSLFSPNEKVPKKDMWQIFVASMIGLAIPQMTFLISITMTTSIDTSILASFTPIMTMFVAAIAIKEPITWKKVLGVAMSFCGALLLIMNSVSNGGAETTQPMGVVFIFINCLSFAIYLGVFRPLISRYNVVTFMKWMFLYSTIVCLPFCIGDAIKCDYQSMTFTTTAEILFVVIFATFVAYFLIPIGQKNIRPTLVSLYSYVQPIIAVIISISIGLDSLSFEKCIAIVLVFTGVAIVNKSRSKK